MRTKKKKFLFWIGLTGGLLATVVIGIVTYSEWKLAQLVPGGLGERFPTRMYSAPFVLTDDLIVSENELIERLTRLEYRPNRTTVLPPGSYRWEPPHLTVALRGMHSPITNQEPMVALLTRTSAGNWVIQDHNQLVIHQIVLEPELIAELSGPQKVRREPATWEDIPPILVDAVVAVEDRRFFKHYGIDLRAIVRAAWFNVRHRKNLQGGSTITQQLAKNFFLTQERTLRRKIMELGFAIYLDLRYSKERILTLYLNHIYLGQDGVVSIAGVKAASQFYFGKPLNEITLPEAATLAGLIRSPYRYNPFQNPLAARARRDRVLKLMLDENAINERDYEKALAVPLTVRKRAPTPADKGNENEYFVAEVLRQLVPHFSEDVIFRYGLKIYTTLDPVWQKVAQQQVRTEKKNQAALVAMDPRSGRVFALVGGKNYRESQFNRATQAHRQPGSAFKPFVYGAGLEDGFTPASILQDEPRVFKDGKKIWAPQNFDGIYRGPVSFREALAHSINGATLDLAQKLGPPKIIAFARKMGIESVLATNLAISLGISEVTPFELTTAYAPFANGGFRVTPLLVTAVIDSEENALELNNVDREPVLDSALSYLMISLLQTTVTEGTAKNLQQMGWTAPSAGKTGTTNEGKDAWFIGTTPGVLAGVWVGDDEGKAVQLTGAKNALPIWGRFMKRILEGRKIESFEKPEGVIAVRIDPVSGMLARSGCPNQRDEIFISGTEPKTYCTIHAGGLRGWFQKLFQRKGATTPAPVQEAPDQD